MKPDGEDAGARRRAGDGVDLHPALRGSRQLIEGDVEAASGFFEEALASFRSTGDRNGESEILEELAGLAGASWTPPGG